MQNSREYFLSSVVKYSPAAISCNQDQNQALSVRALQEIISSNDAEAVSSLFMKRHSSMQNTNSWTPKHKNMHIAQQHSSDYSDPAQGKGLGSGHKTLLYGNAILLRHSNSDM